MSTMIRIHVIGPTVSHEDLECLRSLHLRAKCDAPRREGSIYDGEVFRRIYDEVHGGEDIGPCGHYAAIEEGDQILLGEDSHGPTSAVSALFPRRYETIILTNELVYDIVKIGRLRGSGKYNDRKTINWLSKHIGDEVFCVHW